MGKGSRSTSAASSSIASPELEGLLNTIDNVRSHGSSTYIDLPQIIVCGDQSSGKSSCLEAICGVRFPVGDGLCTRFPTEYMLRRAAEETFAISIVADPKRPEKEKARIAAFKPSVKDLDKLSSIIDDASKVMGIDTDSKTFAHDVLRIELSGPDLPNLTLVDLPGLFHSSSKTQSDADKDAVFTLVGGYIERPRSIILAVVSAKNDINNQAVLNFARKHDPEGKRTLGVITKPDTLSKNSPSESMFFKLACNDDIRLALGWHILRNRSFEEQDTTTQQRDLLESQLFKTGLWQGVGAKNKGVVALRGRLCKILEDHIFHELPGLMKDVDDGIQQCQLKLDAMGSERRTSDQQRQYLSRVSMKFTELMRQTAEGLYQDSFFGAPSTRQEQKKRLSAVANEIMEGFAQEMRIRGHAAEIVDEFPDSMVSGADSNGTLANGGSAPGGVKFGEPSLGNSSTATASTPAIGVAASTGPIKISKDDFYKTVIRRMKFNAGRNLPGLFDPGIIKDLVIEHLEPWQRIVDDANKKLLEATDDTIALVLRHCADKQTIRSIRREIINQNMDRIQDSVARVTNQLLKPCREGVPRTRNHYFIDNIQKMRQEEEKKQIAEILKTFFPNAKPMSATTAQRQHEGTVDTGSLLNALAKKTEINMDRFAAIEAVNAMLAYYKVVLKRFIDDFQVYVVDECLLIHLPKLFTPEMVTMFDDGIVRKIAGESEQSAAERDELTKKLEALRKTQKVLRGLNCGAFVP